MSKVTLKTPEAIVLELTGCIATSAFMAYSTENRTFVRQNIQQYFKECYPKQKNIRLDIQFFQLQEVEDDSKGKNKACPRLPKPKPNSRRLPPEEVIGHILWKLSNDITSPPMSLFLYHMTEWGYKRGIVQTPIYDEVIEVFNIWKQLKIEIYVNVASASFVNMVLSRTNKGNIAAYFSGHMNLVEFQGTETRKLFDKLPEMIKKDARSVLFITRFPLDARAASTDFLPSVLILRDDFDPDARKKLQKAELDRAADEWKRERRRTSREATAGSTGKTATAKTPTATGQSQTSSERSSEPEVSQFQSGVITFSSTLHMINEANKKRLEEDPSALSKEEIGATFQMIEEAPLGDIDAVLDVRNTPSKIVTADIRELNVIGTLADLNFV